MRRQFYVFLIRWAFNSFGLWVAVRIIGSDYSGSESLSTVAVFMIAGLVFSIANAVIRPIITILALPAISLTLGLFMLVVNGLMVYLSLALTPGLSMTFGDSILAGIILSLVNYIIDSALVVKHQGVTHKEDDNVV
ncbi:phage holin family protein [Candidatus Saccharibacteria bacterium]|nr:phage holin family protein [Candidatus Saccharibacteria bacterium]